MFNGNDDIALFMSFFDIPVSLDNLIQRITSINDRLKSADLNNLFKLFEQGGYILTLYFV